MNKKFAKSSIYLNDGDCFDVFVHSLPAHYVEKLLEKNILKKNKNTFTLNFVGVFCIDPFLFICFPKMMDKAIGIERGELFFSSLLKFKRENSDSATTIEIKNEIFLDNLLPAYQILADYKMYGILSLRKEVQIKNGRGKINWKKTIDRNFPILNSDGAPVYVDLETKKNTSDLNALIIEIQKFCVCMSDNLIGWAFGGKIAPLISSSSKLSIPIDNAIMILRKELRQTYEDRRIRLYKLMISFLSNQSNDEFSGQILGVTSYWRVWEHMCSRSFKNKYSDYKKRIPYPVYGFANGQNIIAKGQRLDIITEIDEKLLIIDAKYYDVSKSMPEWTDIVKQLYYEKSLRMISDKQIKNMFCFPDPGIEHKPLSISIISDEIGNDKVHSAFPNISCIYYDYWDIFKSFLKDKDLLPSLENKIRNQIDNSF